MAVLGAAAPAMAAEGEPKFEIMGPSTCAQWPKSGAISSAGKAVPLNWTLGFLSGWAALGKLQLLDLIDAEEVDTWMTDYCGTNPTATLPLAARELERVLEAKLPAPPAAPAAPMFVAPQPDAAAPAAKPPATKAPVPRRTRPR
jgi:hypothetical protein